MPCLQLHPNATTVEVRAALQAMATPNVVAGATGPGLLVYTNMTQPYVPPRSLPSPSPVPAPAPAPSSSSSSGLSTGAIVGIAVALAVALAAALAAALLLRSRAARRREREVESELKSINFSNRLGWVSTEGWQRLHVVCCGVAGQESISFDHKGP